MDKKKPRLRPRAGRPTLEQAKSRHRELLEKSLDLFLKKGYQLTTLDAVARALHMTKRTIYSLYPNKEALFKAAVEHAIHSNMTPIEELEAMGDDDLEAVLNAVAHQRVKAFLNPTGIRLQRVISAESYRFPELYTLLYDKSTRPTVSFLIDLLKRHAERGEVVVEKPEVAAAAFLSMAVGGPARGILTGHLPDESGSLEEHLHYCVKLFLNGIRHPQAAMTARTSPAVRAC